MTNADKEQEVYGIFIIERVILIKNTLKFAMRIDAIYALVQPSTDWVDVAERLYEVHDVHPKYWLTGASKEEIKNRFPDVVFHDLFEAMDGGLHNEYETDFFQKPLDSKDLVEFREYESTVLKMMGRRDRGNATGNHFTYVERIRQYHRLLSYWIRVVEDIKPDVVFFGDSPHAISDYLLYAVCDQYDIETLIFTHTYLPDRFCVRKNIRPLQFEKINAVNSDIPSDLTKHLQKLRGEYSQAKPEYMNNDDRSEDSTQDWKGTLGKANRKLINIPYLLYSKMKREQKPYSVKAKYYKQELRKQYQQFATEPSYSAEYIYFPLHYQPERTTCPEGGEYAHQYLAVNLLASAVPDDVSVYVKEHPSQFAPRLNGEKGRDSKYYESLNSISNVEMITLDSDQFKLIDESKTVATVTGRAGWESLVRGTPAVVFGNAWYRDAPGCYHVKTREQVDNTIKHVLKSETITQEEIDKFVSKFETGTYRGLLRGRSAISEGEGINKEKNIDALYKAVCENCTKIPNQ